VRIKIEACGICHSDAMTKEGLWPGIHYPRVPGHEVVGTIDAIGNGVSGWTKGQRVGVGWHGAHCGYCDSCRRGDFVTCQVALQISGPHKVLIELVDANHQSHDKGMVTFVIPEKFTAEKHP